MDPGNAVWQRDLSVAHNKIGDVLVEQGSLPAALEAYNASLAIREQLGTADPDNASRQADLAVSCGKLGRLFAKIGEIEEARRMFEHGRTIIAPFAQNSGHQIWIGYLQDFDADLAQAAARAASGTKTYETITPEALRQHPASLRQLPNQAVEAIFTHPQLQGVLHAIFRQNNIDVAPADLPIDMKRSIVEAVIAQGIIQFEETDSGAQNTGKGEAVDPSHPRQEIKAKQPPKRTWWSRLTGKP